MMMQFHSQQGKAKPKPPNTFIGGVGLAINTPELVAGLFLRPRPSNTNFYTITASEVKEFKIIGNNIEFYISGNISLTNYLYTNGLLSSLTYIKRDSINYLSDALRDSTQKFVASYNVADIGINASYSEQLTAERALNNLRNCLYWFENAVRVGRNQTFWNVKDSRVYMPEYISAIFDPGDSQRTWFQNEGTKVYVQSGLSVNHPDGYLSLTRDGTINVIEILSTDKPASVTDLSASRIGDTATFTFTNIIEGEFYEVWQFDGINEGFWRCVGEISGTGQSKQVNATTGLRLKIATCDEYWNGSGFFEDETKRAFSNEITI